jgi:hypothetical protein
LDTVEPLLFFYREEIEEKGQLKNPPTAREYNRLMLVSKK